MITIDKALNFFFKALGELPAQGCRNWVNRLRFTYALSTVNPPLHPFQNPETRTLRCLQTTLLDPSGGRSGPTGSDRSYVHKAPAQRIGNNMKAFSLLTLALSLTFASAKERQPPTFKFFKTRVSATSTMAENFSLYPATVSATGFFKDLAAKTVGSRHLCVSGQ